MLINNYKTKVLEEIRKQDTTLFDTGCTAVFFEAGNGLVAKIFFEYGKYPESNSESSARSEFDNLKKIHDLKDDRLNVPRSYDVINLGTSTDIHNVAENSNLFNFNTERYTNKVIEYDIYATIMEYVEGTPIPKIDPMDRDIYQYNLDLMIEGLIDHSMRVALDPFEIILSDESNLVSFVDVADMTWEKNNTSTEFDSIRSFYHMVKELYWSDKIVLGQK